MFAKWIPEALVQLESLALGPDAPMDHAIKTAREMIVNQPEDVPFPKIDVWSCCTEKHMGISLRFEDDYRIISPHGDVVTFN